MLGKLIIIGIIIVAAVILVPSVGKMFNSSSINALEDRIDKATSDRMPDNVTSTSLNKVIGAGDKLVNTLNSTVSKQSSIQTSSLYELSSQYVTKQNYTGQVFQKNGDTCDISVPGMAQMINGQRELTHVK